MPWPKVAFAALLLAAATAVSARPEGLRRRVQVEREPTLVTPVVGGAIAYVLEPFNGGNQTIVFGGNASEGDGGGWFNGGTSDISLRRACLKETDDNFKKGGCVEVDYDAVVNDVSESAQDILESAPVVGFGRTLQDARYHSCLAATQLTLRIAHYPAKGMVSTVGQARITLLTHDGDDFHSDDIDIPSATAESQWSELSADLPFGDPSLGMIRGWRIQLLNVSGAVYLDRLACVGGNDMMSSAFTGQGDAPTEIYDDLVSRYAFVPVFYESEVAAEDSTLSMSPFDPNDNVSSNIPGGVLFDPYFIEQTKSWGGFSSVQFLAPGPAFYDLSGATSISFQYETLQAASPSGRVHLRFILHDSSHCVDAMACLQTESYTMEAYYSFHHILDETGGGINTITIDLVGNGDSASPFWRTGWEGKVGNDVLDKSTIKGWNFEINIDSQGEIGSIAIGSVMVGNITANFAREADFNSLESDSYIVEPDLLLDMTSSAHKKIEFISTDTCHELCHEDAECLYGQSSGGKNCFLYSSLSPDDILLKNTELIQTDVETFWMDDIDKRGDFCNLCDCNEEVQSIDCSDRELAIVPKSFMQDWSPLSLDLRGNPNIVIVGGGALSSISDSLQELWLPQGLRHLSAKGIQDLPKLSKIHFEGDDFENSIPPNNVIRDRNGAFQDICCGLGEQIELSESSETLTFCDMQVDKPGIDTIYEPFVQYLKSTPLMKLKPSSDFMSEAAVSAEYCAEYCTITDGCNYFSYDARWKKAEHSCYLLINNGTSSDNVCCDRNDYGDQDGTLPGWTSGHPPRTRNAVDNAAVMIQPKELAAGKQNDFTVTYSVSLGSTPLRGVVWIEPHLEGAQTDAIVTISPTRVSLYDANTTATFEVVVSGSLRKETLTIVNSIQSCDKAYTSGPPETLILMNEVFIIVNPDKMNFNYLGSIRYYGYFLVVLIVGSSIACAVWVQVHKDAAIVRASQPIFLYFLLFGIAVLGFSIVPLTFDDNNPDNKGNDAACIAFPWLLSGGLNFVFSALFCKIWRINKIFRASRSFRHIKVTVRDVLGPLVATLSMTFLLCLIWTLVDPPRWKRVTVIQGFESYGICSIGEGVTSTVLSSLLLVLNFLSIVVANIQAYLARGVSDDFSESKYVALAMVSIMQIFLVGVPLVFLTSTNPAARFFVFSSMILVISMSVLVCLFAPKFRRMKQKASETGMQYSHSTISVRIPGVQLPSNRSVDNISSIHNRATSERSTSDSDQNPDGHKRGMSGRSTSDSEQYPSGHKRGKSGRVSFVTDINTTNELRGMAERSSSEKSEISSNRQPAIKSSVGVWTKQQQRMSIESATGVSELLTVSEELSMK